MNTIEREGGKKNIGSSITRKICVVSLMNYTYIYWFNSSVMECNRYCMYIYMKDDLELRLLEISCFC